MLRQRPRWKHRLGTGTDRTGCPVPRDGPTPCLAAAGFLGGTVPGTPTWRLVVGSRCSGRWRDGLDSAPLAERTSCAPTDADAGRPYSVSALRLGSARTGPASPGPRCAHEARRAGSRRGRCSPRHGPGLARASRGASPTRLLGGEPPSGRDEAAPVPRGLLLAAPGRPASARPRPPTSVAAPPVDASTPQTPRTAPDRSRRSTGARRLRKDLGSMHAPCDKAQYPDATKNGCTPSGDLLWVDSSLPWERGRGERCRRGNAEAGP